jgi:hypothetical protein
VGAAGQPDLDAYLRRTSSGELVWELHGVIYEARDEDQRLTLRRENRALILTMAAAVPDASAATMRSTDARDDDQRDKWEQLMAIVETQAI